MLNPECLAQYPVSCNTKQRRLLNMNDGKTEIIVIRGSLRNVFVANFGVMSFGDTRLVPCESAKNHGVVLASS